MATYGTKAVSAPAGAIIIHPGDNVAAIVNGAPEGATFFFQAGTYHVSLTPKDGQTFIGSQGAILNGSQQLTDFVKEGAHWSIGGQTQEGIRVATDEPAQGAMRAGYPETVFMDDKPLTPVDALSKLSSGEFYFDYAANKIYLGDNPAGHKIEAGKLDRAFEGGADGVTVQNFVIEKYNTPTQYATVQGNESWTIKDNEVRLNYGVGVDAMSNSKIVGNYVHDNGEMGMGGGGENLLVEGNEIARNGYWSGIDVFWEGGGTKFTDTDGLIVRNNYSHDNHGFGMWTDIDNIRTLYEGNVVVDNSGGGINHEISYDAVIRNNILKGNGYESQGDGWMWGGQIQIQNSKNVDIYGNKIDMTGADGGNGIGLIQQDRGSGAYGAHTTTGNKIHDNIIVSMDGNGKVGGAADFNENGMLNGGNVWSNNHYYLANGDRFWWGDTDNFSEFKSASGETGAISQSNPNVASWVIPVSADHDPVVVDPPTPPRENPVVDPPTPPHEDPVVDHPPADDSDMRPPPPVVTLPDNDVPVVKPPPPVRPQPPFQPDEPDHDLPSRPGFDQWSHWYPSARPQAPDDADHDPPSRPVSPPDQGTVPDAPSRDLPTSWRDLVTDRGSDSDSHTNDLPSHWYTYSGLERLFGTQHWDSLTSRLAQHDDAAPQSRSTLTEIVELDLASGRGAHASTPAPTPATIPDHWYQSVEAGHDTSHDTSVLHNHDRIFG